MIKCSAKCSKGFDRCCHKCELRELCKDVCSLTPENCEFHMESEEMRYNARTFEIAKRFWRLYIIGLIAFLAIVFILLIVIGNQNAIMEMQTDTNNQIMDMRQDLDEQSIDDAAESRLEVNSEALGTFTITHYCSCAECCGKSDGITATGTMATEGRTIAVDPKIIPLGSEVLIDGQVYIAEDVGGAIKGKKIDIYVNSHQEAISRGKITREVRLVE